MARKPKYINDKSFNIMLPFSVKELGMSQGEDSYKVIKIEGYASYSGDTESDSCCFIDRSNDVVVPAGMDLGPYTKNPVVLLNHDRDYPIGKSIDIQKKPDGIFVTAEIHEGAMEDEDFYAIEKGLVNSFSIGFRTKAGEFRTVNDNDVYFMTKTELFEVSVVTIPCNTESGFSITKSFGTDGFGAFNEPPAQPVPAVTKSVYGDDTMKLKQKELLTAEGVEQYKALGLDALLEGEVEVSTKSYIDSHVAKQLYALKLEIIAEVAEKFKAVEVADPTETTEEETSASEEAVEEATEAVEDNVEAKSTEVETVKSLSEMITQLKALAA